MHKKRCRGGTQKRGEKEVCIKKPPKKRDSDKKRGPTLGQKKGAGSDEKG